MDKSTLREAGLKITSPRIKILQIMAQNTQAHFTAEAVCKALSDTGEEIGLATVYRLSLIHI